MVDLIIRVLDFRGDPFPGATVEVFDTSGVLICPSDRTNAQGEFLGCSLPEGTEIVIDVGTIEVFGQRFTVVDQGGGQMVITIQE